MLGLKLNHVSKRGHRSIKSFKLSVILIIILACIPPDAPSLNDCYSIITVTTTIIITISPRLMVILRVCVRVALAEFLYSMLLYL